MNSNTMWKIAGLRSWNNNEMSCHIFYQILDWGYFSLVLSIVGWRVVFGIVQAIIQSDIKIWTKDFLILMVVVQLIAGRVYFSKNHYDQLTRMEPKPTLEKVSITTITVISLIVAIIGCICLFFDVPINGYSIVFSHSDDIQKGFLTVLLFFNFWISYLIYTLNCFSFIRIFISIQEQMISFRDNLDKMIQGSESITLNSVAEDFARLKLTYKTAVQKTSMTFSSLNLFGALGSTFIIVNIGNSSLIGSFQYLDMTIFIMVELVYLYVIQKTTSIKSSIKQLPYEETSIRKYLSRYISPDESVISDVSFLLYQRSSENAVVIDWIALNSLFKTEFEKFQIFGFEIENTLFFQKAIALLVGVAISFRLFSYLGLSV